MAQESWRLSLQALPPDERRLLAERMNVNDTTLWRWGKGQSTPQKPEDIRNLAKYLAKLEPVLRAEFPDAFDLSIDEMTILQVPATYATEILGMYSSVAKNMAQHTIHTHVYEDIVSQLDPHKEGMMLLFAQCVAQVDGMVKVLEVRPGYGTNYWSVNQIDHPFLLGRGTLCGAAVSTGNPAFYPQDQSFQRKAPLLHVDRIQSVGVFPVTRWGEVAGALFVASAQKDFFSSGRRSLMKTYADMFGLGLKDRQFYNYDRIDLAPIPSPEHQGELLQEFYAYMEALATSNPAYQDLPTEELERKAIQKIQKLKEDCMAFLKGEANAKKYQ